MSGYRQCHRQYSFHWKVCPPNRGSSASSSGVTISESKFLKLPRMVTRGNAEICRLKPNSNLRARYGLAAVSPTPALQDQAKPINCRFKDALRIDRDRGNRQA